MNHLLTFYIFVSRPKIKSNGIPDLDFTILVLSRPIYEIRNGHCTITGLDWELYFSYKI